MTDVEPNARWYALLNVDSSLRTRPAYRTLSHEGLGGCAGAVHSVDHVSFSFSSELLFSADGGANGVSGGHTDGGAAENTCSA
jgi:hypothetical protein